MQVALKEGLFTTGSDARLLAGRCLGCARLSFPAQSICPYCAREGCETTALTPRGVIEVCTTVINRPPGYEGTLPFGFGVVELPEGIRIIARIANPESARPGATARLIIEPLCIDGEGREVMTYAFEALQNG